MQANPNKSRYSHDDSDLRELVDRLHQKMQRDALIQKTTDELRDYLKVDRVVIYYFYRQSAPRSEETAAHCLVNSDTLTRLCT